MKLLCTIFLVAFANLLFAQNQNVNNEPYRIKIKVNEQIEEHTQYLLRLDLQKASDILIYKDINAKDSSISFISNFQDYNQYKPIIDQYFSSYNIYSQKILIYTTEPNHQKEK